MDPDEIVERWHCGEWPYRRLEDVMCQRTGWSHQEYDEWARTGAIPSDPELRRRAS